MITLAHCLSCRKEATSADDRFCVRCGFALRQRCPVCSRWNLVGGGDLKDGRCSSCKTLLRICGRKCGRLHAGRRLLCSCPRSRRLPVLPKIWASFDGPTDGSRAFAVRSAPAGDIEPTVAPLELDLFALLDDGLHLVAFSIDEVQSVGSNQYSSFTEDLTGPSRPVAGDGTVYAATSSSLVISDSRDDEPVRYQPLKGIVAHSIGHRGWVGLTREGKIVDEQTVVLGSTGPCGDGEVLPCEAGYLIRAGRSIGLLRDATWEPWTEIELPDLCYMSAWTHDGIEQLWVFAFDGDGIRGMRVEGGSVVVQSQVIPGGRSLPPIMAPSGLVFFISTLAGEPAIRIRLSDGNVSVAAARSPAGRVLASAGIDTPSGFYLLVAAVEGGKGFAVFIDPVTGSTVRFLLPADLPLGWKSAQWLIRSNSITLATSTGETSTLLTYPL